MSEKERPYPMPKEPPTTTYPGTPTRQTYAPQKPPQEKYPTEPQPKAYYPPQYVTDNLDLPNGEISGYFQAYTLDYDRDPNRVLERVLPWYVISNWSISGTAVIAFGGTWHLTAFAEQIGPNETPATDDVQLFQMDVPVSDAEPGKHRDYQVEVTVPANAIPADGAYKVVLLLTHSIKGKSGKEHVTRMAGFVEIPMLQFYTYEE